MDNDRFHPLSKEYLGEFPATSKVHYGKHKSIRRLRITNEKISISASCENQDELRLVRMECDGIRDILKNATYYWSVIKPRTSSMCLPTLDKTELLLNGKEIPEELVTAQFQISQDKAFDLIRGNNIYLDENFVFLRELLQNAIDATKIQYFRDCKRQIKKDEEAVFANPKTLADKISPSQYPIDIELSMKKCKNNKYDDMTEEDITNSKGINEYEYGVLVKIQDYATGISEKDIQMIEKVGSSYSVKRREINKMPQWLQPTGAFGIGLQSVFLVAKVLKATTYTRDEKKYEITFYPRQGSKAGYINVMPKEIEEYERFGTCFEVFVPYQKRKCHADSLETWDGIDPFEENYEERRVIRHSRELMKQMGLYIEKLLGELLFPINIIICDYVKDKDSEVLCDVYKNKFFKEKEKINEFIVKYEENEKSPESCSNPRWVYDKNKTENIIEHGEDFYYIDCEKAKLYVWNHEFHAYACVGIKRIMEMKDFYNSSDELELEKGVQIFYKGIRVTRRTFKQDADLVEYIDLKDTLDSKYLKLNRNGFSSEGDEYLEKVYQGVVSTIYNGLQYLGNKKDSSNDCTNEIIKNLETLLKEIEEAEDEKYKKQKLRQAEELILSATALVYFSMAEEHKEEYMRCSSDNNRWNKLLKDIQKLVNNKREYWKKSSLFNISVHQEGDETTTVSILDIIDTEKKYAIVAERNENGKTWKHWLLQINNTHKKITDNIRKLKCCININDRRDVLNNLESFSKKLIDFVPEREWREKNAYKEEIILKWILSNISTIALYASEDGNTRINVLSAEIGDSIFFDCNMKKLIIERMKEFYPRFQRFSIPVWTGYEKLYLEEPRKSIKFVKRGKFSKAGYGEMIFPLSGEELLKMDSDKLKYNDKKELEEKISMLYNLIVKQVLEKLETEEEKTKGKNRYWGIIKGIIDNNKENIFNTFNPEVPLEEIIESDYEMLKKMLLNDDYSKIMDTSMEEKTSNPEDSDGQIIWDNKFVPRLLQMNIHIKQYQQKYMNKELESEVYETYLKPDNKYKTLSEYVLKHSKSNLKIEEINACYCSLIYEIKDAIFNWKDETFFTKLCEDDNRQEFFNIFLNEKTS